MLLSTFFPHNSSPFMDVSSVLLVFHLERFSSIVMEICASVLVIWALSGLSLLADTEKSRLIGDVNGGSLEARYPLDTLQKVV